MYFTLKRSLYRSALFIFTASLFFSCQKELSMENGSIAIPLPDLSTKVSSSVSGFVTDENDAVVMGATVQFGASNTTTDKYGYFEVKNAQVVKEAAFVTVNKPGYFKGIKTYTVKTGQPAFFRIKLIPKTNVGNINSASGGAVTLSNGLNISLPAGAVVNAASNTAYTGTVNVAAFWINPEAADLNKIMPGDLRGINTEGAIKLLQTFGMAAVELTGASGELLQIATGKKATLTLSIPSSLTATAPATIPLWYFDETKGLWKEEGSATKTGNTYVGDVSHFSYWNCDFPCPNRVQFDCTLVDANGNPLPDLQVWVNYPNGQITGCHGTTNENGYAAGAIPANSQLVLYVYNYASGCGSNSPLYTQAFSTTTSNISLGTITIPNNSNSVTVTGTLSNCNNLPVANGYIMMYLGNQFTRHNVSNGSFSFMSFICGNNNNANFIGGDLASMQEGPVVNVTLQPGNNNIGNVVACGTAVPEFINYSLNAAPYTIAPPGGQLYQASDSFAVNSMAIYGFSNPSTVQMGINNQAIAQGSNQALNYFTTNQTGQTTIGTPITVHITEYGSIGQFIAGNFTGTVTGMAPPNTSYAITCNFRVRRNF